MTKDRLTKDKELIVISCQLESVLDPYLIACCV